MAPLTHIGNPPLPLIWRGMWPPKGNKKRWDFWFFMKKRGSGRGRTVVCIFFLNLNGKVVYTPFLFDGSFLINYFLNYFNTLTYWLPNQTTCCYFQFHLLLLCEKRCDLSWLSKCNFTVHNFFFFCLGIQGFLFASFSDLTKGIFRILSNT